MAENHSKSRHGVTQSEGGQQANRGRRSLPILPFAEIYTVIDLVSIDAGGAPT
jgi:hypothetical protein